MQRQGITMIRERIERLKSWVKASVAAVKARIAAFAEQVSRVFPTVPAVTAFIVASDGNVLDTGKRYRAPSGHAHAPVFTLYTFFARRHN
jgi:hypothetical protein